MADEGFQELFLREYPNLVRELRLIVGPEAAEDVASDAFEQLCRLWAKVSRYERPGAWVRMVALRTATKVRRRSRKRSEVEAGWAAGRAVDRQVESDIDLVNVLGTLSVQQRAAVALHHVGGYSAREIGEFLECEEATVRTHLFRGRQKLAVLLRDPPEEVVDAGHG